MASHRCVPPGGLGLLGPLDLAALRPGDFEMTAAGDRIPLTNDCVRDP